MDFSYFKVEFIQRLETHHTVGEHSELCIVRDLDDQLVGDSERRGKEISIRNSCD